MEKSSKIDLNMKEKLEEMILRRLDQNSALKKLLTKLMDEDDVSNDENVNE